MEVVAALEYAEDPLLERRGNPGAVVFDRDSHPVSDAVGADPDL